MLKVFSPSTNSPPFILYCTIHTITIVLSILSLLYSQSYYPYCHYCTLIYTHLYWSHSGWLLLLMILHLLMLLLLAYILLLPYCQSQRYYCTIYCLIVIGWSLLLTATTRHTAPTELIQEKRQHQCHYQDH